MDPNHRTLEVYRLEAGRWVVAATHGGNETVAPEPFAAVPLDLRRWWGEAYRAVRRTISIPAALANRLDREAKRRRTSFSARVAELAEQRAGGLPPYTGVIDDDPDLSLCVDQVLSRLAD